jgi:type I restriction enzyme, S subunit
MNKYPAYKDSGIEWIGKIPENWEIVSLKHIASVQNGSTPSSSIQDYWDGDINWVTTDDLGKLKSKTIFNTRRTITLSGYQSCGTTLAPVGSVVISTRAPIGHIGILEIEACTNQGCKTIIPQNVTSEFCYFFLLNAKDNLVSLGQGSTFKELPTSALKDYKIVYPSTDEQIAISNYLNLKTREIDTLISNKQKLIELLQEERTTIINQAVTKGLNPNVSLKDSGIEWIGEIPEHWTVNKFGRAAFFQEGPGLRNWQFTDSGVKVICVTNIVPPKIDFSKMTKYISTQEYEDNYKHFTVQKGDILLASFGASWGKVAEYDSEEIVILNTSTIRLNEKGEISRELIKWIIQSPYISENLNSLLTGSCQPNFGPTHLNKLICVYPKSIEEQTVIVNHLNNKTEQINTIIGKTRQEIDLLKEYKIALISEVVTGKVDVREEILEETCSNF